MQNRSMRCAVALVLLALTCAIARAQNSLTLDEALALAKRQNPDIIVAQKQLEAARGGVIEARAALLPSVISTGLLRKRAQQEQSRLRNDDYNASVRVVQSVYTSGANKARVAIARLLEQKRALELAAVTNRVAMDLRSAYYELLLNRSKIEVREEAVSAMRDELRAQEERFAAGTVGELNVRRAEVSLGNEQPELYDAQTRLRNSYLRLDELCGLNSQANATHFQTSGRLQYRPSHPDLAKSLAEAAASRPEIRAHEIDVEIEEQQLIIDRSELRPRVEVFGGYELYSERDPAVGPEFNHGYVIGLNGSWHIFDGYATRGRMQATRARRDAAKAALEAAQRSVEVEVRSAFLDLEQADRVLESETRGVQNANQSLELARGNLAAGLASQLDVLQATADVTKSRTTRLNAIYLHNLALARLARATAREPEEVGTARRAATAEQARRQAQAFDVARPPSNLSR